MLAPAVGTVDGADVAIVVMDPVGVAVPAPAPPEVIVIVSVPMEEFDDPEEASRKFAQIRRVVLLVWITMLLSPKKYGDEGSVER